MSLQIHSAGVDIKIDGESKVFNGLDLQVKAIKALIEMLDFKFAQEDDMEIIQKTHLVLLDAIGAMIKLDMPAFDNGNTRNIEAVHQFLDWVLKAKVHEQTEYAGLLDQDEDDNDFGLLDYLKSVKEEK